MIQVNETGTVLDRIIARTQQDLILRKEEFTRQQLQEEIGSAPPIVDIMSELQQSTVTVIAEVKRASPSKGRFPVEIDPAQVARQYKAGGARMISCLTDGPFFQGSLGDLDLVVGEVGQKPNPVGVLRKDFIIDEYQIDEARVHGASCILLIAACLDNLALRQLHDYATTLDLAILVEVHNREELDRALAIGPRFVGINNRDLKTFVVDLNVTEKLAPAVPNGVLLAAESGIFTSEDVSRMAAVGADAVLVGESLILQPDRSAAVAVLDGQIKVSR